MVQINFALREVNCKIVYYGPGMSGKTTNLEIVHKKAPEANKGELTSIATEGDRTLFFDFMPLDLGTIAGMRTRFQLYTVPGQVYYNSTRKLVLQGVDGIVFVADSSEAKMEENLESLENLKNNLAEYGKDIREIPLVLQWNKRDLPDALTVEQLNERMNHWGCPYFEAVAISGEGVFPTLKCLSGMVLETLNRDHRETTAATSSARQTIAASAGSATGAAVATAGTKMSGSVSNPAIRTGSTLDQMMSTSPAPKAPAPKPAGPKPASPAPKSSSPAPVPAAAPAKPAAANQTGKGWQQPRKVDATPLEQTIRARPQTNAGPRQVQIAEKKSFPWIAVGLAALIAVAAAVVLVYTGIVELPF
jgi:signal recognition particle receptor subunit beta